MTLKSHLSLKSFVKPLTELYMRKCEIRERGKIEPKVLEKKNGEK